MSAPRVLVVAYDFPPHAAIGTMRTLRVVREFDARGWHVDVLTGDPRTYLPTTPVDRALLGRVPPRVRIIRAGSMRPWERLQTAARGTLRRASVSGTRSDAAMPRPQVDDARPPLMSSRAFNALARGKDIVDAALSIPDREVGWALPATLRGVVDQLREAPPDVIYSSAPPWTGQLVAAALKRVLRRPWVADFRDPWARAPWREDRYRFAMRAAARLERFVVRTCDRIVFVAAANRDDFAAQYGPALAVKFDVVSNGCDPAEFDAARASAVVSNDPFVLLHAGSLYAGRTPLPLLEAIATAIDAGIVDRDRFRVRFLGANGLQSVDLPAACRRLGLEQMVEFLPRVTRAESVGAIASATALLLLQPGHTVSVPGKVYEYLAAGRPILAIAEEGEISSLIRAAGAGISVAPDRQAAIVEALAGLQARARRPTTLPPRECFDGTLGAARIVDIVERVACVATVPSASLQCNEDLS